MREWIKRTPIGIHVKRVMVTYSTPWLNSAQYQVEFEGRPFFRIPSMVIIRIVMSKATARGWVSKHPPMFASCMND